MKKCVAFGLFLFLGGILFFAIRCRVVVPRVIDRVEVNCISKNGDRVEVFRVKDPAHLELVRGLLVSSFGMPSIRGFVSSDEYWGDRNVYITIDGPEGASFIWIEEGYASSGPCSFKVGVSDGFIDSIYDIVSRDKVHDSEWRLDKEGR